VTALAAVAILTGFHSTESVEGPSQGGSSVTEDGTKAKPRRIANPPGDENSRGYHVVCPSGQAPYDHLPPVARYECRRTTEAITVDGKLDEGVWERVEWSTPFVDIADGEQAKSETRLALLWDDEYLYVGYRAEDHDIRGTMGEYHDHIYMRDNDVEIFVAGDGYYYEMGLNPINNMYELRWTWLEPLVREQRFAEIEALHRLDDFLYYIAREGDQLGRYGDLNYHLDGLQTAVHIDGVLNQPRIRDNGWTVEMVLPWKSLADVAGGRSMPPKHGDMLRITGYRMDHTWNGDVAREHQASTWSVVGCGNIHIPERWSEVTFVDDAV